MAILKTIKFSILSVCIVGLSLSVSAQKSKELSFLEQMVQSIGQIPAVAKGDESIQPPAAPAGYRLELKGTDRPQVVDKEGHIFRPLVDVDVLVYYQLIDEASGQKTDVPNKKVSIPGEFKVGDSVNDRPEIIPTPREWLGHIGYFTLKNNGRIIIDNESYQVLKKGMDIFANDMTYLGDWRYTLDQGKQQSGAIYVSLDCNDKALGDEGYRLTIDQNIVLEANTPEGAFMGTRSILQLINIYGNQIPKGIMRDYPKYARRGFMLDAARKFFRMEFLQDYIRIMSYYKMNEFQVHLNDNGFKQFFNNDWDKTYSAFRLASDTYPGLTAKDGSYTKEEFTDLQKMGMSYGINLIPEIDIPAHSLAFTHYKPSLGSREYGMDHLDITKKETYTFFDALFDEYLGGDNPVFIGPDVHIGTDEYSKEKAEEFRKFTDHYLKLVQSYGKRARLWGALTHAQGETPVTSDNVIMNAWYNGYADPNDMIDQGYELISTTDRHLYIVPAAGYYHDYLNLDFLFNQWEPNLIGGDVFPFGHSSISGGMFAVWNDHVGNGISEKDVHHRAFPALQVLAQKMWAGKTDNLQLPEFQEMAGKLIEAPYVNVMAKVKSQGDVVLHYNFETSAKKDFSPNGYDLNTSPKAKWKKNKGYRFKDNSTLATPIEEIGYPYQVTFDITFDKDISPEAVLFSSANAQVVASPKDGKIQLGFKRDGYYYSFDHLIDANTPVSLAVYGDHKGTSLLIDGNEVERLQGKTKEGVTEKGDINKIYIQQTLVFPLRTIGDAQDGFKGTLRQLKVKNGN
ncbi:hexosaminidase [Saccharicrinis carchari]|uniref:Hexosaminidase n=1 Tax=Saccharicrinis carchari TaxID=1168039 RepID=A0A521EBP8_SACCC|nr:family 20 glycosylhydrolase [Saccharicrinis carchari]SMO81356.1 hexosaminidase [Saccharicrinis carchari]